MVATVSAFSKPRPTLEVFEAAVLFAADVARGYLLTIPLMIVLLA